MPPAITAPSSQGTSPRASAALRVPAKFCWDILLVSLAAWLGAIPLVAYYFNIVTPVSTPANLLAVPLCGLVLISNLSSLILAGWFPAGAEVFNHAGWGMMEWIRLSSHWFASWPRAYWYVSSPACFGSTLYYAILIGVSTGWLLEPKWRAWKFATLALALVTWCGVAWGDMNVEKTPIFMLALLVPIVSQGRFFPTRSAI